MIKKITVCLSMLALPCFLQASLPETSTQEPMTLEQKLRACFKALTNHSPLPTNYQDTDPNAPIEQQALSPNRKNATPGDASQLNKPF